MRSDLDRTPLRIGEVKINVARVLSDAQVDGPFGGVELGARLEQIECGASTDPDCDIRFREAVLRGGVIDRRRRIAAPDSIENRLQKLLIFLDGHRSREGFGRYLDARQEVRWREIAVAGL